MTNYLFRVSATIATLTIVEAETDEEAERLIRERSEAIDSKIKKVIGDNPSVAYWRNHELLGLVDDEDLKDECCKEDD